jgi:hypothetical protein
MRIIGWFLRSSALFFICFLLVKPVTSQPSSDVGFLAISVTTGDDQGPSSSAFVLVRGYRPVFNGESSTMLKATHDGFFETRLPPGVYDIFVSEVSSVPMCKRVEIVGGNIEHYTANLKLDNEHLAQ